MKSSFISAFCQFKSIFLNDANLETIPFLFSFAIVMNFFHSFYTSV